MSYVDYNESLYRTGFRPYAQTDPFAAAHGLNGIEGSASFGPWVLHGELGQHHPFTERGGWTLRGLGEIERHRAMHGLGDLGAAVPDGAIVTYNGRWQGLYNTGAQDILNEVSAALAQVGLPVRNASSDAGGIAAQGYGNAPFNVQLQIQVNTGQGGFGDPNDIISDIRHAVYIATGVMPLADSIPTVQVPGATAPAATGQPTGAAPGSAPPGSSTDFLTWFESNAAWIGIGLVGVVLLPSLLGRR